MYVCLMICWWIWYLLYMQSCKQVPKMTVPSIAIRYIPNSYDMHRNTKWQYRVSLCDAYRMFMILRMNDRMYMNNRMRYGMTEYVIDMNGYDSYEMYELTCVLIWYVVHVWCCYSLSGDSYKSLNFSQAVSRVVTRLLDSVHRQIGWLLQAPSSSSSSHALCIGQVSDTEFISV